MTYSFAGKTAVVTGAASGIGAALAARLAERGCHLALADINETGLTQTLKALPPGVSVTATRLDVADRAAVKAFAQTVDAEHGGADAVFNNAGVAVGGAFDQVSEADFDWLLSINLLGAIDMTRAFLPLLKRSQAGRLINISSLFGLIAPAGQTAYCASKFGLRGFSDALRHELAETRVGVVTVHPGGINTSIAASARAPANINAEEIARQKRVSEKLLVMPPDQAAQIILNGVERGKRRILVGRDAKLAAMIERLTPDRYWSIIGRRAGGGSST